MARGDSVANLLEAQSGRPKFIQTIAFTGTGALTTLTATDVYGFAVPAGATLLLEADQDFLYELRDSSAAASAVTVIGGARPGKYVKALAEHKVTRHSAEATNKADAKIDVIGASGNGNLSIFWIS